MKISWHKNPLWTVVELDEHEKRDLWWKIRSAEMLELLEDAHAYLQDGAQFDLANARKAVSPDYYQAEDGRSQLDQRVDVLLAHYIGELASNHVGDCTCVASSCSKCHAEALIGINTIPGLEKHAAHKIAGAFGKQNEASLDEAIESLRTYDPKPPADLDTWNKVGGWDKHVPRWKAEAAAAHAWLVGYRHRFVAAGVVGSTQEQAPLPAEGQAQETEYERLYAWRSAWQRLASKKEPGRLQSRQERIERRASICNAAIGRLMSSVDESNAAQRREDQRAQAVRSAQAEVERCSIALSHAHARLSEAERGQS